MQRQRLGALDPVVLAPGVGRAIGARDHEPMQHGEEARPLQREAEASLGREVLERRPAPGLAPQPLERERWADPPGGQGRHAVLVEHPSIVGRIQSGLQYIGEPELARLLRVENYVVAWGVTNAAAEGLADDMQFTFGENVLLAYFDRNAGPENETAGALFSWTGFDGADQGVRFDRYQIPERHVWRIEGFDAVDMKVTDASAGVLFIDALT